MQINLGSNYSKIISPQDYNLLMTDQHLYIKVADQYIAKVISEKTSGQNNCQVIEIGCGPGRISSMIYQKNKHISLYGLDVDSEFINYAKENFKNYPIQFVNQSVFTYVHKHPVDIFYSQGFHHHISKDHNLDHYLKNIFNQLKVGGYYIVGDEFVSEYKDASEREVNLVLWYCHIISKALDKNYQFLAQEEAKTLLDDIYEGHLQASIKNNEQINLVLEFSPLIDQLSQRKDKASAISKSEEFLQNLKKLYNNNLTDNLEIDLSRRDFKISPSVFEKEVKKIGFIIENSKFFGPVSQVGAMGVYILYKP